MGQEVSLTKPKADNGAEGSGPVLRTRDGGCKAVGPSYAREMGAAKLVDRSLGLQGGVKLAQDGGVPGLVAGSLFLFASQCGVHV